MIRYLRVWSFMILVGLFAFTGTALAAAAVDPSSDSFDVAKAVYSALAGGHYAYAGALLVILIVALVKRYLGPKVNWLHSDSGGATMALVASSAAAMAAGLAGGGPVTLGLVKAALLVGVGAAGGFAVIKSLIIEPLLKPLASKVPAKFQWIFNLVLWIFDKPASIQTAEQAGDAAVAAAPATGATGVIGDFKDVP